MLCEKGTSIYYIWVHMDTVIFKNSLEMNRGPVKFLHPFLTLYFHNW